MPLRTGFWCHCLSNFKTESACWERIFQNKWSCKTANPKWSPRINSAGLNEVMKNGHKFYGCVWNTVSFLMLYFVDIRSILSFFFFFLKIYDLYFENKNDWSLFTSLYHPSKTQRLFQGHPVLNCTTRVRICSLVREHISVYPEYCKSLSGSSYFENDAYRVKFMQLRLSLWS